MQRLLNEPVLLGGAIRAIILAGMAFGLTVTPEQLAAVMMAVEAVLAIVTRGVVTPTQLVKKRDEEGRDPATGEPRP